jgi:isocitrate dehydrogenase
MYWAQALAKQTEDSAMAAIFTPIAQALTENETKIVEELIAVQGKSVDIKGYYNPNRDLTAAAMRPSATLNAILEGVR